MLILWRVGLWLQDQHNGQKIDFIGTADLKSQTMSTFNSEPVHTLMCNKKDCSECSKPAHKPIDTTKREMFIADVKELFTVLTEAVETYCDLLNCWKKIDREPSKNLYIRFYENLFMESHEYQCDVEIISMIEQCVRLNKEVQRLREKIAEIKFKNSLM